MTLAPSSVKFYIWIQHFWFIASPIVINEPQALAIFPRRRPAPGVIEAKAKSFTVLIDCPSPGSGIIYDRQGNTYRVLTAWHVVQYGDDWCHTIQTPDGQRHPFNQQSVQQIAGLDVAILEFESNRSYTTARSDARSEFGNPDQVSSTSSVYVAGYPEPSPGVPAFYVLTVGQVAGRQPSPLEGGYSILYTNETSAGFSGGPVLDSAGKIIAIHGQSENLPPDPAGPNRRAYKIGIPVNSFLDKIPPPEERRDQERRDQLITCPTNIPWGIYRNLRGSQTVNGVTIAFYCALLNTSGTYIAQFYIQNNADRTFLSMPVNARVFDANGDRVTARVNVDRTPRSPNPNARGMIIDPGRTLWMTVTFSDRRWIENHPQGLVLQIQEDSRSRRLFQVPF